MDQQEVRLRLDAVRRCLTNPEVECVMSWSVVRGACNEINDRLPALEILDSNEGEDAVLGEAIAQLLRLVCVQCKTVPGVEVPDALPSPKLVDRWHVVRSFRCRLLVRWLLV